MKVLSNLENGFFESAFEEKIARWIPAGNSTTITAIGAAALTATGTATAANASATNGHTQARKLDYLVTAAATNAIAGFRAPNSIWWRGNQAGFGGFNYLCQWGPATGVATATNRAFVGMSSVVSAPTDVEPSSLTNMIGMGWDSADTNIQIMTNDGSGTATKIDLGSNFPVPSIDRAKIYELRLYAPPNGSQIQWQVKDLGADEMASGVINSDMIPAATFVSPRGWMSAGGTSSVIGIALFDLWIKTGI